MATPTQHCPCCGRFLEGIFDYPQVQIISFERLPLPEAVDDISAAAAQKSLEWQQRHPGDDPRPRRGINLTPEIERACRTPQVQQYLNHLAHMTGREFEPAQLLPSFPPDRTFKRCFPIADTALFLTLAEGEPTNDGLRTAKVQTLCRGPNLGSAGGPTLMHLGAIARLTYQGRLMGANNGT